MALVIGDLRRLSARQQGRAPAVAPAMTHSVHKVPGSALPAEWTLADVERHRSADVCRDLTDWLILMQVTWLRCPPDLRDTHAWRFGVVVVTRSVSINEVNLRWARLVLWWLTVSGFDFQRRHFILVCNQPPRSTQTSTLRGTVKWVNEYQPKGGWGVKAGMACLRATLCCHTQALWKML